MDKATPTPPPAYEAVTIQALDAAFAQEIRAVSSLEYNSNEMCRAFYANLRARLVEGCLAAQSAPTDAEFDKKVLTALECGCIWTEKTEAHERMIHVTEEFRKRMGATGAQSAPLQQADCTCDARDMPFGRCCRAAAQVEPPSMPSSEWLAEAERLAHQYWDVRIMATRDRATREEVNEAWADFRAHLSKRVTAQVEPRGTDAQILFERKLTCEAIQGAMAFGYQGTNPPPTDADHWLQPFWDIGNRTRQLEQAATLADFHRIMAMPEAEVDAELRSLGIDPDKAAERADRAIKGALAGAQVEPVRMLTEEEPEKCYSLDEENFHDFGDFMDMLDEDQCKPGFLVFEGDSVRHTASHYACGAVADMFERMGEQAFDEAGEHIGDWPDHAVKGERLAELERLIFDWLDANVKVHFYTVKNVRQIALTADMLDDDDAGRTIPASGEIGGV